MHVPRTSCVAVVQRGLLLSTTVGEHGIVADNGSMNGVHEASWTAGLAIVMQMLELEIIDNNR